MTERRAALLRSIGDKLYEKRKATALEIEELCRELVKANNTRELNELLSGLAEAYHSSTSLNLKKGVLLGLAASAIGFGRDARPFLTELLGPILHAAQESDSRLRYFACESLYNVTKAVRTQLIQDHFLPLFNVISILTSDHDQNVRSGAELLDRLLKDVVSEAEVPPKIGQIIRERIYAVEPTARLFIAGWIDQLSGNPNAGLGEMLPGIIDGLFNALDDKQANVQRAVSKALQASLKETSRSDISQLLPIIADHLKDSNTKHWQLRYNALLWLRHLIPINNEITVKSAAVCIRALFNTTDEPRSTEIKEAQRSTEINELKSHVQQLLKQAIVKSAGPTELATILEVVLSILNSNPAAKLNCFKWLDTILDKDIDETEVISRISDILQSTAATTDLTERDVGIEIVTKIADLSPSCFDEFIRSLTQLIEGDHDTKAKNRIAFILRAVCATHRGEKIYSAIANLVADRKSVKTIRLLGILLATAPQLHQVRAKLRDEKDGSLLFDTLWSAWMQCTVSSVALALISRRYDLAYETLKFISEQNLAEDELAEFDRLVQLIESPGFTSLRFELLQRPAVLIATLYGILMLLPQSAAFDVLLKRLSVIPTVSVDTVHLSDQETTLIHKLKNHHCPKKTPEPC